jgi:hypothetical protein
MVDAKTIAETVPNIDQEEAGNIGKIDWSELPLMCWKLTYYKEAPNGKMRFYEYDGDHSSMCEGIDEDNLIEISEDKA